MSENTIAAFDFDGTLTYHDTLIPFFTYTSDLPNTLFRLCAESPAFLQFALGYCTRQDVKERFISRFFQGTSIEYLRDQGAAFAAGPLMHKLRPEAVAKLRWHQTMGHRCILVSANLDVYLEPWHRLMGFDALVCSQLEVKGGLVTGKLAGANCWGHVKQERLLSVLNQETRHIIYAYGDSRGDQELLAMADFPFYRSF